jgi:hypothetical protein
VEAGEPILPESRGHSGRKSLNVGTPFLGDSILLHSLVVDFRGLN